MERMKEVGQRAPADRGSARSLTANEKLAGLLWFLSKPFCEDSPAYRRFLWNRVK